jgi:hypothetical protein
MTRVVVWVAVLCVFTGGCGDTTSTPQTAAGQAMGGAAGANAGSAGKASTPSGGAPGSAAAGDDEEPPVVMKEADPEQPCQLDPLAAAWRQDVLEHEPDRPLPLLSVGGELVLMVHNSDGTLRARSFEGDVWSDALLVNGATDVEQLERVEVSRDGSGALLIWSRQSGSFATWYTKAGGFQPPITLPALALDVAMLSGARAVIGFADGDGANAFELSATTGIAERAPVLANYDGLFNWGEDGVAVFSASSFVAGPDALIPFEVGQGFGDEQELPPRQVMPSSWQSFFRAFHNGRAARIIRVSQDAGKGSHVTTLQGGAWGAEEHLNRSPGDALTEPLMAEAGAGLVAAWYDADARRGVVREHAATAWQAQQTLPRGRSFVPLAIAGGKFSALVMGEQLIIEEQVNAKKLYRRGEDGTWYCAKLLPNAVGGSLHGDGSSFWYLQSVAEKLTVSSLRVAQP